MEACGTGQLDAQDRTGGDRQGRHEVVRRSCGWLSTGAQMSSLSEQSSCRVFSKEVVQ